MPTLKALPGRVILRFPKPQEKMAGGLLYAPQTSQQRPEFGEIHDVGDPLNEDQRKTHFALKELQRDGKRVAVSFAAGIRYWQENLANEAEWTWLKDYRCYSLSELAAYLDES